MNIQNKSRYHEVHARSLSDPEGFWAEAAREIDWIEPAKKIFDPAMGAYGRWFAGGVVNTCYNALDRHVAGGRADQVALIHDSPLTNTISKFTYAEMLQGGADARRRDAGFRRRQGRPRHPLYADGAGSGVRDAGLRADRRGAFGGVRRFCREGTRDPDRGRQAEADFFGELRHRARPHRAVQAAARRGDQAFQRQAARPASSCSGRSRLANSRPAAITTGRRCAAPRSRPARPRRACRCWRPIRSIFSTRRAPPESRRASCATMAGIWSR